MSVRKTKIIVIKNWRKKNLSKNRNRRNKEDLAYQKRIPAIIKATCISNTMFFDALITPPGIVA